MGDGWMSAYREAHRLFLKLIKPGITQLAGIFIVVGSLPDALAGGWKRDAAAARKGFSDTYKRLVDEVREKEKRRDRNAVKQGAWESIIARHLRESQGKGKKQARLSERDLKLVSEGPWTRLRVPF